MLSYDPSTRCPDFTHTLAPFLTDEGLPFAQVVSAADVADAFAAEGVTFGTAPHAVFAPALTLGAFLSPVIDDAKSCRAAVRRVAVVLIALGREPCAEDTAAYGRARARLPTVVMRRLAPDVGRHLGEAVPTDWRWHGRHVYPIDGTTVTAPDTAANQKAYPQSSSQKPGLGFPIPRWVVLLSLATAAPRGMAAAPYQGKGTGETALARPVLGGPAAGNVLLADRYYCTYWLAALAQARGVDVVFRMHHRRHDDFRRGRRLGPKDHVVVRQRPARPDWMGAATYATMPETLAVREPHVALATPGCRTRSLVVVPTPTEAAAYAKEDIADLYHRRWHAELDSRAVKQSLKTDHLRCRTPAMLAKELWAHFLGYNLVRKVSAPAALTQGIAPRAVRFTATKQAVAAWWSPATSAPTVAERVRQGALLLQTSGTQPVGDRPDRYEPRAVKRRPKGYNRLTKPRAEARAALRRPGR